jgi:hypothetical protein
MTVSKQSMKMRSSRKYPYSYHGQHFGFLGIGGNVDPGIPEEKRVR